MSHPLKSSDAETRLCPIKSMFARKKGRPSNAMAGDVEERILDAATAMFLQHGFSGASLDRIAEAAGAGKATVYSRYSGKEALFAAVVARNCERRLHLVFDAPRSMPLAERLKMVTQTLGTRLLSAEVLGMMRVVVADAPRFPSLAKLISDAGRSRSIEALATMLAEHSGRKLEPLAHAEREALARSLATQILDATIAPLLMKALLGENLDDLRNSIPMHVERTVGVFVAAKVLDAVM